jgi:hypothetical protein
MTLRFKVTSFSAALSSSSRPVTSLSALAPAQRAGAQRLSAMAQLYGPAVRCKLNLQTATGLALLYPALAWSKQLLAIMDIRARPISFSDRPRRPVGPPDHERDGETVLHLLKSNSQTSAGVSYYRAV